MKWRIFILIIFPWFYSCEIPTYARFEITNNSGAGLDSVNIEPNERKRGKFISLNPNEKVSYYTDMTSENNDGSYIISYRRNGIKTVHGFGYFTNGAPLHDLYKIRIDRDSINAEEIINNY